MKVINMFGGPGTGKSTTAAGLFFLMKLESIECEMATEYAKYLVWAERVNMFKEQGYIFVKQNHKLEILEGKVDYAITDCPLLLSSIYGNRYNTSTIHLEGHIMETFNRYDNINIFLTREKKYSSVGRNQTEKEADEISMEVLTYLEVNSIPFITMPAGPTAPWEIYEKIFNKRHLLQVRGKTVEPSADLMAEVCDAAGLYPPVDGNG